MFSVKNLQINRGRTTASAQGKDTSVIHTYIDDQTTVANIRLYFPPFLDQGATQEDILLSDYMFVTGSDTAIMARILSLDPFMMDIDLFSGAAGLSVGAPIPPVDGNAAKITLGILQMEIADQTHPGIMTQNPQDFGGEKTFHANVNIQEPVNGLVISKTMGSFGVELITSDPSATPGFAIKDTAFPSAVMGLIYNRSGFITINPEMYILSGNNSGIVFNNTDGIVTILNKAISNHFDSQAGNPLFIGDTNATVINLGTNTAIDPTKELLTNQIDSATAAPLIIGVTNTTEVQLNKGVKFATAGGTPANLNVYETFDHNTTFTNNTQTSAVVDIFLVQTGDGIILRNATVTSVPGQVAPAAFFTADTLLPARFRPGQDCNGPFRVENNGIFSEGWIEVTAAGNINIYNNVDFTTAFTAAVTNGFSAGTFAYSN